MSTLNELIAELCPDGVPFKTLGQVGEFIRGNGLQKKDFVDAGFPCIHYGQIYTYYGTSATVTKSHVSVSLASTLKQAKTGDLVVATTSENEDDVCTAVAWMGAGAVAIGGHSCVFRHTLDPMYVAYYFQSRQFHDQKRKYVFGTKVKDIKLTDLARVRIPVPPLEVQREVARILGAFAQMEAELKAELEARRAQREQYLHTVLDFSSSPEVRSVPLSSLAEYSTSRVDSTVLSASTFVGVDNLVQQLGGRVDATYAPNSVRLTAYNPEDILLGNIRPYLRKLWFADRTGGCSGDVLAIRLLSAVKGSIEPKFLYHVLCSPAFWRHNECHAKGAKMPRGDKSAIMRFPVPVPNIQEQQRIIRALDSFQSMVSDLASGLPAEITARRKQYEHYRERLLTFKELEA